VVGPEPSAPTHGGPKVGVSPPVASSTAPTMPSRKSAFVGKKAEPSVLPPTALLFLAAAGVHMARARTAPDFQFEPTIAQCV
jgi:hypothetical protein